MTVVDSGPVRRALIARVKGILLQPKVEWSLIESESASIRGLFTGYACILAAIPAIAVIIQHLVFVHWLLIPIIVVAVLTYIFSLVGVYIMGLIIDALAPSFDGQRSQIQAMKVAVYPYTAVWVAGVLNIIPVLGILAVLAGLYGLYIFYLGLPKLMKCPAEKAVGYVVVSIVVAIVVNIIMGVVIGAITAPLMVGALVGGAVTLGGG